MKTIKIYLSVCLLAVAATASAQFANSNASSSSTSSRSIDTDGWNRVSVSFNPMKAVIDTEGADDLSFTGFSFSYAKGFSIAKQIPLFVEAGINATYAFNTQDSEDNDELEYLKDEGYNMELKTTLFSLNIPVNLAYKFSLTNSNLSIVPYLGVNFRGNIIGKSKYKLADGLGEDSYYDSEKEFWEDFEEEFGKQDTNNFDKKETGSKDATWKRFQMGWQIGIGLNYKQLYASIGYGKDFTELCKKVKISTTSITLGYNF